jgi:hypothetical protein
MLSDKSISGGLKNRAQKYVPRTLFLDLEAFDILKLEMEQADNFSTHKNPSMQRNMPHTISL